MKVFSYFRSSAAYRVRIALNYKNIPHEYAYVHLLKNGGEEKQADYAAINPQQLVPALQTAQGVINQSLAIIEYLEEQYPSPSVLPGTAWDRAQIRSMANMIACDIHPLNNLRVQHYLSNNLDVADDAVKSWMRHWIEQGFQALEAMLQKQPGEQFCVGDSLSMADICLIPQVYNARRISCDLTPFPKIEAIYSHCMTLESIINASPEQQMDNE